MEIQFIKTSPTQNVTILVLNGIPRAQQPQIAAKLLEYDGVGGEQVGFIEKSDSALLRLQMMGGEFCGNASMAAGAYLAWREGLDEGDAKEYPIEVSGAEKIVRVNVAREQNGYRGRVEIPAAERIETVELDVSGRKMAAEAVKLPGITHLILPKETGITLSQIENEIRKWNETLRAEALGALIYDESQCAIAPVVYVPGSNTVVRERGCGSGTAAIGCKCALQRGECALDVRQPGGVIRVFAKYSCGKFTASIEGNVRITARGVAYMGLLQKLALHSHTKI